MASGHISNLLSSSLLIKSVMVPILVTVMSLSFPVSAQKMLTDPSSFSPEDDDPQRTEPVGPLNLIDNIYSVSAVVHYPSFLITTPEGHFLIDTSLEEFVPGIVRNIEALGFDPEDVKYLLTHHAHVDHVGGHAMMQEITGATTIALGEDAHVMESGGRTDFREREPWTPARVDRIIQDLDQLQLGDTVLTAHHTPGHSKGCTTWAMQVEENGRPLDVVFFCGLRMNPEEALIGNPDYPNMAEEFAYAFAKLKALPVDVFLASHGYWFNFNEKYQLKLQNPEVNPFIDPESYHWIVDGFERAYIQRLRQERGITTAR